MPETIIINDIRKRTKYITIDLSNPMEYYIEIHREEVKEVSSSGEIFYREETKVIREKITFDENEVPSGNSNFIQLLLPIRQAIEAIDPA